MKVNKRDIWEQYNVRNPFHFFYSRKPFNIMNQINKKLYDYGFYIQLNNKNKKEWFKKESSLIVIYIYVQ